MKLSKEEIALIEKARAKHAKKTAKKAKAVAKPAKAKKLGRPKGSKNKTTKTPVAKTVKTPKAVKATKTTGTKAPPTLGEVKEAIAALQTPSMREKALELLAANVPNIRTGSNLFEKEMKEKTERTGNDKYLSLIISDAEKRAMAKMSEAGLAYRHIEAVFHLLPANGMNAYRCVGEAKAEAKKMIKAANKQGTKATKTVEAPTVEVKTEAPAAPVVAETPVTVEAPAPAVVAEAPKVVVTVEGAANVEVKTTETPKATEYSPELEALAVQ